jgi:hypothetical protein
VDRASHFIYTRPKDSEALISREKSEVIKTQIQRAVEELGGHIIFARSPQAKGSVERLFGTLQGKVSLMFNHRGVTDLEEVNEFLSGLFFSFLEKKYAYKPALDEDSHRPVDDYDLRRHSVRAGDQVGYERFHLPVERLASTDRLPGHCSQHAPSENYHRKKAGWRRQSEI